jgi:bifunctional DNA-binding transcriptional regulator/antitoxin component of YhaV-PrlF toxin-antitoxin module
MDSSNVAQIVGSEMTVSDKIRALDAAGYPRADIARVLGKRYQHVRNVLEADRLRRPSRLQPGSRHASDRDVEDRGGGAFRLVLRDDGSVLIPQAVQSAFGLSPGKPLMARLEGEEFKLVNAATAVRRIQETLRPYMKDGESWADSLIADRRREAAEEESDG